MPIDKTVDMVYNIHRLDKDSKMKSIAYAKDESVLFENTHDYIESAIATAQRLHYDYSRTTPSYSYSIATWSDGKIAWSSKQ